MNRLGGGLRTAVAAVVVLVVAAPLRADVDLSITDLEPYDLKVRAFELPREIEVEIDVTGMRSRRAISRGVRWWWSDEADDDLSVYAWLLDAGPRRPVWVMQDGESERVSSYLRRATKKLKIGPGRYELYFFSGNSWMAEPIDEDPPEGFWERLGRLRRHQPAAIRDALPDCRASLTLRGIEAHEIERFEPNGERQGTLLRLAPLGDGRLASAGFQLDSPARIRVSTNYERTPESTAPADYGWIVDERTREVVWRPAEADEEHGGGAEKNRRVERVVELRPGRYEVYYGTDDSHSFDRFNAAPPVDPFGWGISLLATGGDDPRVTLFDPAHRDPLIEHRKIGNRAFVEEPFRLDRDGTLHVTALGEYAFGPGQFVDGAWIVDATTGEIAWSMTERNTLGAGGAEKNRRFDGLVSLAAGEYVLYYATDRSHAHGSWNAATPFDVDAWGVRVAPGPDFPQEAFARITVEELASARDYLVRLDRVGDNARVSEGFRLDRTTTVEVYAVGEGRAGEMFDYGWIVEDESGRRVWEMSYPETGHAGGAEKNRSVRVRLTLAPGSYEVVFRTDDSHSFDGWNASRPDDPVGWGIKLRRVAGVEEAADAR